MSGPEAYLLPRDEYEKRRLDLQHTVITRHFNGCLPKSIVPGPQAKILDTGCGTGVWSIDLAKDLPSTVTFHACDISPDNFPSAGSNETPANVHFAAHSVLAFPSEWSDSFDVIHQRLMQGGITQAEWRAAMKEMYRILRPGGHIVLVEIDHAGFTGALSAPVPAADKISGYWKTRYSQNDRLWDSRTLIPGMLKEAGFQDIQIEDKIFSIEGASASTKAAPGGVEGATLADDSLDCMLRVFQSFKKAVVEAKLVDGETYEGLIEEMASGWKNVPKTDGGRGFPWFRVAAQKPLN